MSDDLYKEALTTFSGWYEKALTLDVLEPTAAVLATASASGQPSARVVLLKSFDERGFVFFSNARSIKGRQLEENPSAALCFYWGELLRQVHVEGAVELIDDRETDAYWNTRDRSSRVGAVASVQSALLSSRDELIQRFEELSKKYSSGDVPRPDYWVGYRLTPEMFEFWTGREHRLHERLRYVLDNGKWAKQLLSP